MDEEAALLTSSAQNGTYTDKFSTEKPHFLKWHSDICNCTNIYPSCCMAVCCSGCFVGQMYEKLYGNSSCFGTHPCIKISLLFIVLSLILYGITISSGVVFHFHHTEYGQGWDKTTTTEEAKYAIGVNNLVSTFESLCFVVFIFFIRQGVRKKYGIPPESWFFSACCSGVNEKAVVEDVVCACCCGTCSLCQAARHMYDYSATGDRCRFTSTGDRANMPLVTVPLPPEVIKVQSEYGITPPGSQDQV